MTTVLLDTHVLHWWSLGSGRLSKAAERAIASADELAVSSVSWFELAWLAQQGRITATMPLRSWLEEFAEMVRTTGITPAIAATAAMLGQAFPKDPTDRIIYATAIETGWPLVTRDERLREHKHPRKVTIW